MVWNVKKQSYLEILSVQNNAHSGVMLHGLTQHTIITGVKALLTKTKTKTRMAILNTTLKLVFIQFVDVL